MASEQRLYTISQETKAALRKFRLGTSRAKDPQAVIYQIDKKSLEIQASDDGRIYKSLQDVADELPDNAPRFILLSHPLTLPDGRLSVPYVLLSYIPSTCSSETRMVYAGSKELLRREAEVNRVYDVADEQDVLDIADVLQENSS